MRASFLKTRKLLTTLILLVLAAPAFAFPDGRPEKKRALTEDQRILHVLNRLGFGPRPGDLERVRAIGLDRYIAQQLDPASLPDRHVAARLREFEILSMRTDEIFARYPNPGALLRMLEGNGRNGRNAAPDEGMTEAEQQAARRERRQKLISLYREYDLKPANQIMFQVQASRILRAVHSERQLEEAMVDFWANHFNVYARKAATRWYIPAYERDVLRKHALGNFRDLVTETAKHPAMLFYLDNFQSVAENADTAGDARQRQRLERLLNNPRAKRRFYERMKERGLTETQIDQRLEQLRRGGNGQNRRGINENYARELMELHTLGVDGGYTAEDIREVARAFTGWTIFDAQGYRRAAANTIRDVEQDRRITQMARRFGIPPDTESGTFVFVERLHDKGPKTILGRKVDEGGMRDGLKVIDILVKHPSTARFIARKLAVRFVSDDPDEELVERVARAFRSSDGDIKATLRALFTDPEFYAPENYRAKIKTPFELLVSSLRALDAETDDARGLIALLNRMGEPLYGYQAPTGYPDRAEDWVNTGALLERMNFAVALASNRIPRTRVDLGGFSAPDRNAVLEKALVSLLNGEVSAATKQTLVKQMARPLPEVDLSAGSRMTDEESEDLYMTPEADRPRRNNRRSARLLEPSGDPEVFKIVALILGSPEFQRQ